LKIDVGQQQAREKNSSSDTCRNRVKWRHGKGHRKPPTSKKEKSIKIENKKERPFKIEIKQGNGEKQNIQGTSTKKHTRRENLRVGPRDLTLDLEHMRLQAS
jgi:hypothetical protein